MKKKGWHEFNFNEEITCGKILIELQWIFSKVKYLKDILEIWDENIREIEDDKKNFIEDIKSLFELLKSIDLIK